MFNTDVIVHCGVVTLAVDLSAIVQTQDMRHVLHLADSYC